MTNATRSVPTDLGEYRLGLRAWLGAHAPELPDQRPPSQAERFANGLALGRALWAAGWKRVGWPAALGGLGGGARHRATYYDELGRAGVEIPDTEYSIEVMAPAMLHFAPALAEAHLPGLLAGEEIWAQGFSEPDAGSDLASLRTRGEIRGDVVVVNGQKVWTSHGHRAARLLVLVRTGPAESRHRGLAALLVDTDTPGLTRTPLRFASGIDEMCETFLDDVRVPVDRMVGGPTDGWSVAMFMLQYERSMYAAQRQAWLGLRLRQLVEHLGDDARDDRTADAIHGAWLQLQTVRARSIETVRRLDAGDVVGPETSADKILLARAEQSVFEVARRAERSGFLFADAAEPWREGWWYSRAATLLGGAGEIQRSIVADRVLRLPQE